MEIDLAIRLLAFAVEAATRIGAAVSTSDDNKEKLAQLAADAEALRVSLEAEWKGLAPQDEK